MPHIVPLVLWTGAAVTAPLVYAFYVKSTYDHQTTVSYNTYSGPSTKAQARQASSFERNSGPWPKPHTNLPSEVLASPEEWVVSHERVTSDRIATEEIDSQLIAARTPMEQVGSPPQRSRGLLETFLRTTMALFARTPQAWLIRRAITDSNAKLTFNEQYLGKCNFEVGDRVCGAYVVTFRDTIGTVGNGDDVGEIVVLSLSPPDCWTGPVVQGRLVVGFQKVHDGVRLINETILWRRKEEKPVFLEGVVGRWTHAFMVQWMMVRGMKRLMQRSQDRT